MNTKTLYILLWVRTKHDLVNMAKDIFHISVIVAQE